MKCKQGPEYRAFLIVNCASKLKKIEKAKGKMGIDLKLPAERILVLFYNYLEISLVLV